MDYVIQALTYDLSCHSEDFMIADQNMKSAMKEKRNDSVEFYQKEKIQLSKNMEQIREALKILKKCHSKKQKNKQEKELR